MSQTCDSVYMTTEFESELRKLAKDWRSAREAERAKMGALKAAIAAAAERMTEAQIVQTTGVSRVTVRRAMGKDQLPRAETR